jgi:sirohydrochlorin cobaltochelatase
MNTTPAKAVVLFGHGARDPQWAQPMQNLQQRLIQLVPTVQCELAFLELMEPDLPTCVQTLVDNGCQAVDIIPIFLDKAGT